MLSSALRSSLLVSLALTACQRDEPVPIPEPSETDHQVLRLRKDTEVELQDLRGRWLAAEGLLTRQKAAMDRLDEELRVRAATTEARVDELMTTINLMQTELEVVSRALKERPEAPDDTLTRLARAYEELHCLRRRGAEESAESIYRRYGFEDAGQWASAWQSASRDDAWERAVSARVERLCP